MQENLYEAIDQIFYGNTSDVYIYLKASKRKGDNFDPERQAGYVVTKQNPIIIKAIVRDVSPEKLIIKEMGLVETGAVEILIKSKDIDIIKVAESIVIRGNEYYKYHDAIGDKLLIYKRPFGYHRVILFRKAK